VVTLEAKIYKLGKFMLSLLSMIDSYASTEIKLSKIV